MRMLKFCLSLSNKKLSCLVNCVTMNITVNSREIYKYLFFAVDTCRDVTVCKKKASDLELP